MTDVAVSPKLAEAQALEAAFLGGLEDAQAAYERIVEHEAWKPLGFGTFGAWWDARVTPAMRALSMRPTREIASAVVERVREEEAQLPRAQRRTQRELADMVGVHPDTVSGRKRQDPDKAELPLGTDLEPQPEPEPAATCEACAGPMDEGQYASGFMRCDACDGDEAHVSAAWPDGRDGGCATCAAREAGPEPVSMPVRQEIADVLPPSRTPHRTPGGRVLAAGEIRARPR